MKSCVTCAHSVNDQANRVRWYCYYPMPAWLETLTRDRVQLLERDWADKCTVYQPRP